MNGVRIANREQIVTLWQNGNTYKEISIELEISTSSVGKVLSQAREEGKIGYKKRYKDRKDYEEMVGRNIKNACVTGISRNVICKKCKIKKEEVCKKCQKEIKIGYGIVIGYGRAPKNCDGCMFCDVFTGDWRVGRCKVINKKVSLLSTRRDKSCPLTRNGEDLAVLSSRVSPYKYKCVHYNYNDRLASMNYKAPNNIAKVDNGLIECPYGLICKEQAVNNGYPPNRCPVTRIYCRLRG